MIFFKPTIRAAVVVIFTVLVLLPDAQCTPAKDLNSGFFKKAQPIWPTGRELEKNLTVGFRTQFIKPSNGSAVLKIAGSTLYRIYLNGTFIGHGPARAGHGYYRADEWDLAGKLTEGNNILAIEVAGYNINSYYLPDQPSFIQAEVVSGKKVLAATTAESDDFEATQITNRIQKAPRYSFQRTFTEYYQLEPGYDQWRTKADFPLQRLVCEQTETKNLIPRRVVYPD
ncbi:MAG: hypothetical protein PHY99_03695, partial [Bacteroidales bacterium]|nr:hypothetical protein [Bacteroidales bacterium]